jgi:hypothetical protein
MPLSPPLSGGEDAIASSRLTIVPFVQQLDGKSKRFLFQKQRKNKKRSTLKTE